MGFARNRPARVRGTDDPYRPCSGRGHLRFVEERHAEEGLRPAGRRVTEKFIGYFRLVDACDRDGCPVCRCLEEDGRRELESLLYEHVTDAETRRRLRESWGFCSWHTWMLLDTGTAATGGAILYEDLLRVCHDRIQHSGDWMPHAFVRLLSWLRGVISGAPARIQTRLVDEYRERRCCPVCASLRLAEARYLDAVVDFADDLQFSRAYQCSDGLCLPHLLAGVERSPGTPGARSVLRRTLSKWHALRGDLVRFVSKHEYRNTEPISAEEATSYRRAFEVVAGRPSVFGNDLRRGHADVPRRGR